MPGSTAVRISQSDEELSAAKMLPHSVAVRDEARAVVVGRVLLQDFRDRMQKGRRQEEGERC